MNAHKLLMPTPKHIFYSTLKTVTVKVAKEVRKDLY